MSGQTSEMVAGSRILDHLALHSGSSRFRIARSFPSQRVDELDEVSRQARSRLRQAHLDLPCVRCIPRMSIKDPLAR